MTTDDKSRKRIYETEGTKTPDLSTANLIGKSQDELKAIDAQRKPVENNKSDTSPTAEPVIAAKPVIPDVKAATPNVVAEPAKSAKTPHTPPIEPTEPVKPEATPEDQVKELLDFEKLYGGYKGESTIKDYTPEEKAKLEKQAKKARWSDAAIVLGRALQGKDMQLDKTRSADIRNKLEGRNKEYLAAVEKNNQNKIAWDMNRNQEKIKFYQEQLKRADINAAKKQEYDLKILDLQNEQKRLEIMQMNANTNKEKAEKSKTTAADVSAELTKQYTKSFPNYTETAKDYISKAMGGDNYTSSKNDEYAQQWLNSFSDGKGGYDIPPNVVDKINILLNQIDQLRVKEINKEPGAKKEKEAKEKELETFIIKNKGAKKAPTATVGTPTTPTATQPAASGQPPTSTTQTPTNIPEDQKQSLEKWGVAPN